MAGSALQTASTTWARRERVRLARVAFLEAVPSIVPGALTALRLGALPALQSASDLEAASAAVDRWARRFNLTDGGLAPAWVQAVALHALRAWAASSEWSVSWEPGAALQPEPLPDCELNLSALKAWRPSKESRAEYLKRAVAHLRMELRGAAPDVRGLRVQPQRIQWAVRYQVGGESVGSMTEWDSWRVTNNARTLNKAVAETLALIGLEKRHTRKGRPNKTEQRRFVSNVPLSVSPCWSTMRAG